MPAGARGQWLSADFRDTRQGVLAGHNGAVAHVSSMRVVASQPPEMGLRPLRGVVFANERHGWLAGDGGLMLQTTDGGQTWQAPPGPLPADVVRLFAEVDCETDGVAQRRRPTNQSGRDGRVRG